MVRMSTMSHVPLYCLMMAAVNCLANKNPYSISFLVSSHNYFSFSSILSSKNFETVNLAFKIFACDIWTPGVSSEMTWQVSSKIHEHLVNWIHFDTHFHNIIWLENIVFTVIIHLCFKFFVQKKLKHKVHFCPRYLQILYLYTPVVGTENFKIWVILCQTCLTYWFRFPINIYTDLLVS